jgi:hypothetical protein
MLELHELVALSKFVECGQELLTSILANEEEGSYLFRLSCVDLQLRENCRKLTPVVAVAAGRKSRRSCDIAVLAWLSDAQAPERLQCAPSKSVPFVS